MTPTPLPSPSPFIAVASPPPRSAPAIEVRRAEPVLPLPSAVVLPSPQAAASAAPVSNEVVLKPIKKTWVTVWKDQESSPPIYEDWLYPDTRGLTFRGRN